jgi:hypothetical protein
MTTSVYDSDGDGVMNAANQLRRTVYFQGSVALGDPVYVTGVNGGQLQVNKANASALGTLPAIGVAAAAYGGGATGEIIMYGSQPGWNTGGWAINDLLYTAVGGGLTNVRPANSQVMALVLRTGGGDGVIGVNPQPVDRAYTKSDVGLGNVDNTSDANKPVSTAQQTALDVKPNVYLWNGSAYALVTTGDFYVGPSANDPGAVGEGSVWIKTT